MFNEKTIEDLDSIRSLLMKQRPFHGDANFYNPLIVFDRNGRARFAAPAEDVHSYLEMSPGWQWHAQTKQVLTILGKIAVANVAGRRRSPPASGPDKKAE
jgi:hypothetical protein